MGPKFHITFPYEREAWQAYTQKSTYRVPAPLPRPTPETERQRKERES